MKWQKDAFELFIPSDKENETLHSLDETYTGVSLMTNEECEFLNGIILRKQPKKLLEVGVYAGGSSVIMLNAIKNNKESNLFSIDYMEKCSPYLEECSDKKIGYIVDFYPNLSDRWTLFTGGLSFKFMEKIGGDIDLCLIDTVHSNPGEILDTLMVLPFLKDDAIIVFHDVNLHTLSGKFAGCHHYLGITNNLLFSAINGNKYVQGNFKERSLLPNTGPYVYFPNIGAIKINYETKKRAFEIFNLLTLRWTYLPPEEEEIIDFFSKYYDDYFIKYLKKVFFYHRECSEHEHESDLDNLTMNYLLRQIIKKILGKKLTEKIRKVRNKLLSY